MNTKYRRTISNLMLLTSGAIWGGGFVVMKNALDSFEVNWLLALRFAIGALGLCYTLLNRKKPLTKRVVTGGAVTGLLLYVAYAVQTYGLMYTTAGKNALITAFYVVLTPFMLWALVKRRPDLRTVLAGFIMIAGIALLTLERESAVNIGDVLTLISSVFFAAHIIAVDRFGETEDVMQLTCLQFAFAALFASAPALLFEQPPGGIGMEAVGAIAYCGLCATLIAITFMNVGIKSATPEYASLFLSTEAAFGCIFGVLFLDESLSPRMWMGFALITLALVLSQVDWAAISRKGRRGGNGSAI